MTLTLRASLDTANERPARPMMSRFGLKEVRVDMGLFDFTVVCIVGDRANVQRFIRWKFDDMEFENKAINPLGSCYYHPGYVPIIWIPRRPRSAREYGTLAHECVHAMERLMEWASIPPTEDTEEIVCHGVGHLMTEILNQLKPKKTRT